MAVSDTLCKRSLKIALVDFNVSCLWNCSSEKPGTSWEYEWREQREINNC
jgi:hypothetical protein